MSQTIDYAALLAELQKQAGTAAPAANTLYQAPTQAPSPGPTGTMNFFRPTDSKLPSGMDLANYITANGTAASPEITNRTVKYDGGLTREMLGNTTGFLSNQMNTGFGTQYTAIEDLFNKYGSLGGLGGVAASGNASAVYRPGGQVQAQNGTALPWASTNPFNATF